MNTALNRSGVLLLTNKSGSAVAYGGVVILGSATAASFTTTTTGSLATDSVGVVIEPNGIANDGTGLVAFGCYAPKINLDGAASLGDYLYTDTVAGQATPSGTLAAGAFGQVLGAGTTPAAILWNALPQQAAGGGGGGLYASYAKLQEQQTSGTSAGNSSAGYQTRVLNTEVHDNDGIVSLASNQLTLQAGTYYIRARAPAFKSGSTKLKIYNVTDAADAIIGQARYTAAGDAVAVSPTVAGQVTIASQKTFDLRQYFEAGATNGLGIGASAGDINVFAVVEIWLLN